MSKNRVTLHKGKVGSAKHNEHKFKLDKDVVIYRNTKLLNDVRLEDAELDYYERHYKAALDEQNEKYKAKRQYKYMKSMRDFYKSKRYTPTEEVIQYGHFGGDVPDPDTFDRMVENYAKKLSGWSRKHGNHLHVLDLSCHYDESTPHCHVRSIWDYTDEAGILRVAQEESMKRAGLELPDPTKPESKKNNRNMMFTAMCRTFWQDTCEEFGFDVERIPLEDGRKEGESVPEYHARIGRGLEKKEKELNAREAELNSREAKLNSREAEIALNEAKNNEEYRKVRELRKKIEQEDEEQKIENQRKFEALYQHYEKKLDAATAAKVKNDMKRDYKAIIARVTQKGENIGSSRDEAVVEDDRAL